MNIKLNHRVSLLWLTLFAISMGFLESAVVIYLREILYPSGFKFPLVPISNKLALAELLREAATLFMLMSVGWLSGRTKFEKFTLFLYSFAIWDIFYYVFLKLLINWPESLLSWDILFLIPVTWTGPVIAPVISSLSMIVLAMLSVLFINLGRSVYLNSAEWVILVGGAIFQLFSFIWDYSKYVLHFYSLKELWNIHIDKALYSLSIHYVPVAFNWSLFLLGETLILTSIFLFSRRNYRREN